MGLTQNLTQNLSLKQTQVQTQQIITANMLELSPDALEEFASLKSQEILFIETPSSDGKPLTREDLDQLLDQPRSYPTGYSRGYARKLEEEEEFDYFANINTAKTLQEYLLDQFRIAANSERELYIGIRIIMNIDERGFIPDRVITRTIEYYEDEGERRREKKEQIYLNPWRELVEELTNPDSCDLEPPPTEEEIEGVLKKIQQLDPPGIAARNLAESLLLQLRDKENEKGVDHARRIVEAIMEDEEKMAELIRLNRYDEIAEITGLEISEVKEGLELLSSLTPSPAALYREQTLKTTIDSMSSNIIKPVATIKKVKSYIYVNGTKREVEDIDYEMENVYTRVIKVKEDLWRKIREKWETISDDDKEKLKRFYNEALQLRKSAEFAESVIEKIIKELIRVQKEFFLTGDKLKLKSITMKELAEKIGVNHGTVSRAIKDRYIQTPYGLMKIKDLLPKGISKTGALYGEKVSVNVVKDLIRKLIESEPPDKPYSDDMISQILNRRGYKVARRTVTKYREQMGIPSSSRRKKRN